MLAREKGGDGRKDQKNRKENKHGWTRWQSVNDACRYKCEKRRGYVLSCVSVLRGGRREESGVRDSARRADNEYQHERKVGN